MALRTYSRSFCPFRVKTERKTKDDSDIPSRVQLAAAAAEEAEEMASKPKRSKSLGTSKARPWVGKPSVESVSVATIFSKTYTAKKRKLSTDSLATLIPAFAAVQRSAAVKPQQKTRDASSGGRVEGKEVSGVSSEPKRKRTNMDVSKLHDKLQYF